MQPSDERLREIAREHGTGGWQSLDDMVRFAHAVLAEAMRAREGWVMVPVEPTAPMLTALWNQCVTFAPAHLVHAYRAMLAAAPKEPTP